MYILRCILYSALVGVAFVLSLLGGWLSRRDVLVVHSRYACALDSIVTISTACVYRMLKMGNTPSGFDETG
jgi:hypothetical protein